MELKNYQDKALYWLGRYYDRCRALTEAGEPISSRRLDPVDYGYGRIEIGFKGGEGFTLKVM